MASLIKKQAGFEISRRIPGPEQANIDIGYAPAPGSLADQELKLWLKYLERWDPIAAFQAEGGEAA